MSTILEVEGLTKRFEGLIAVNNVSFRIEGRRIHSLIGPNGAGKTTTLSMINGTLEPTLGTIRFLGKNITGMPTYKISQMGIGRTFQNIKQFSSLTVRENLMVGAMYKHNKGGVLHMLLHVQETNRMEREMREKADDVLQYIGMYELRNEYAGNLAYGRQKLLELGRALIGEPKLILLDEPAAGLNPTERIDFVEILQRVYESGIDLFLIEHNMDVVMNISHDITVLNFGEKIAEGSPQEIQRNPQVIKAYLGDRYAAINKGSN